MHVPPPPRTWTLDGDSHVALEDAWIAPAEAARLLDILTREIPWRHDAITLFGKRVLQPRLTAWMGDRDAVYTYSGLTLEPIGWTPEMALLRERLMRALGARFNSVLLNLYRDGRDSMGFHADDEPELGREPCIASVSLGAARTFILRPRRKKGTLAPLRVLLGHGSLLVMRGGTQHHWVHGVPKEPRVEGARINLTFRTIRH